LLQEPTSKILLAERIGTIHLTQKKHYIWSGKTNMIMSARDLKTELHERIEALTDEQTVQVYEYISTQYMESDNFDANSPEMVAKIEQTLANVGKSKTYSTEEILTLISEWSTR
jgi:hypothetical protein